MGQRRRRLRIKQMLANEPRGAGAWRATSAVPGPACSLNASPRSLMGQVWPPVPGRQLTLSPGAKCSGAARRESLSNAAREGRWHHRGWHSMVLLGAAYDLPYATQVASLAPVGCSSAARCDLEFPLRNTRRARKQRTDAARPSAKEQTANLRRLIARVPKRVTGTFALCETLRGVRMHARDYDDERQDDDDDDDDDDDGWVPQAEPADSLEDTMAITESGCCRCCRCRCGQTQRARENTTKNQCANKHSTKRIKRKKRRKGTKKKNGRAKDERKRVSCNVMVTDRWPNANVRVPGLSSFAACLLGAPADPPAPPRPVRGNARVHLLFSAVVVAARRQEKIRAWLAPGRASHMRPSNHGDGDDCGGPRPRLTFAVLGESGASGGGRPLNWTDELSRASSFVRLFKPTGLLALKRPNLYLAVTPIWVMSARGPARSLFRCDGPENVYSRPCTRLWAYLENLDLRAEMLPDSAGVFGATDEGNCPTRRRRRPPPPPWSIHARPDVSIGHESFRGAGPALMPFREQVELTFPGRVGWNREKSGGVWRSSRHEYLARLPVTAALSCAGAQCILRTRTRNLCGWLCKSRAFCACARKPPTLVNQRTPPISLRGPRCVQARIRESRAWDRARFREGLERPTD
ncbi:Hypothetical predicted protein [Olea europaea subsp. europaea]|uniref:Uncharacterized protein n=1 Tax=Olea europaea subsp. europaea TaxID=158383 RepID=A0A8S0TK99_OLEEU|nr:Hypothetical predicted protein [Olea europaea subsp. europaea]